VLDAAICISGSGGAATNCGKKGLTWLVLPAPTAAPARHLTTRQCQWRDIMQEERGVVLHREKTGWVNDFLFLSLRFFFFIPHLTDCAL